MRLLASLAFIAVLALGLSPALAQTKISGTLTATKACPALQAIKKASNPGGITLVVGSTYKIIGGNKPDPTHYWIVVPGAPSPDLRWVAVDCGTAALGGTPTTSDVTPAPSKPEAPSAPAGGKPQYVLAMSWEPAFCEGLPNKAECKGQTDASFEATHLSLHGLWPQPRSRAYCNVSAADRASDDAHAWESLPAVTLSPGTRSRLDQVMPGTQSVLERHEWIVHGTCYGSDQEKFFSDAVTAASAINASAVQKLFAAHVGQTLKLAEIRAAFDASFGSGAGQRVRVACSQDGDRRIIGELTIGLSGTITSSDGIGDRILAAPTTDGGCTEGIVDEAGLQ